MHRKKCRRKTEQGFTLIELLVVIVILGVLAVIVVFAVGGVTTKGKSSACKTNVKSVEVAEEAYYTSPVLGNGTYTADINVLVTKKLLREPPVSPNYTISVNVATGEVTSAPDCSSL